MMKTLQSALKKFTLLVLSVFLFSNLQAADPQKGKEIFQSTCTSCHKLGERLIGPDLTGVKARWKNDEKKMIAFVHDPTKFFNTDPYVMNLVKQANGAMMTPQDLTDEQIADVLAYVDAGGDAQTAGGGGGTTTAGNGGGGVSYSPLPQDDSTLRYLFYAVIVLMIIILILASKILQNLTIASGRPPKDFINWQKLNAVLMPVFVVVFFGLIYYEATIHMKYVMPGAASEHGKEIDRLFNITVVITGIVFVVTQLLLFWYSYRYRHREGRKAYFYSHNNTVEFIWTSIPAVVLAGLVLYGFKTWQKATSNPDNNPIMVEAFAKQFDWTFRYPGPDGKLGRVNFMKIDPATNPLGIDFSDPASKDDFLATELHLPVNRDIYIKARSQDVTHAVYLPHFRAQIYAQPGMDNRLRFKPVITTAEMRKNINNPKFNYELACNQLCGAAHFNMRRVVVVENDGEFKRWQSGKKPAYDRVKASNTALK